MKPLRPRRRGRHRIVSTNRQRHLEPLQPALPSLPLQIRTQTSAPSIPMCNSTNQVSQAIASLVDISVRALELRNMVEPTTIPTVDWNAVRRRLRLIRAALGLPTAEVEAVINALNTGNEANLIAFADQHGQSLDWIVRGDLAPMLQMLGRSRLLNRTNAPGGRQR